MRKALLSLTIALCLGGVAGCQSVPSTSNKVEPTVQQTLSFATFSSSFIDELWQVSPTWALYSGYHKYDGRLEIPNDEQRQRQLNFAARQLQQLHLFDEKRLSTNELIDYRLIENQLQSMKWQIETYRAWQWDPSRYNVAGGFARIINEDFAPLDERLKTVVARLEHVPAYYDAAQANIVNPTVEHTQLALQQNQGVGSVLSDALVNMVTNSGLNDDDKALFTVRYAQAKAAVSEHIAWLEALEAKLTKDGARSFRIGEALYEQKFGYDIQAGMSAKQLYQKALADKNNVQREMAVLTDKLWPKYFSKPKPTDSTVATKQLIDLLSAKHVQRDEFVDEVKRQIPGLIEFVESHDLLTLDPNKPLVVRETPEYMRGFAGASVSAPGPYEKHGNTYYNVSPLDSMSDESAESYLREYNHWILQVLNIHEAIPGHYTQLVYSNESPSLIKSLLGNGAMIEGWAVYVERMMLEQGYSNFEPEMWLMYYKWNLRVICNTILDYSIQVKGMQKEEAIDLMVNEAFQQMAEAEGKWRRATLSQVQLTSYYSGFREIYDLRAELKASQGENFDLKSFHETFLSFGSAPVNDIKQMMLK